VSLVIAYVEPERALLGVDTLAHGADGSSGHITKLLVVPHIGAAVAFNGCMPLQQALAAALFLARDLDSLVATFAQSCTALLETIRQQFSKAGLPTAVFSEELSEVVLAGWSAPRRQMVGRRCLQRAPGRPFELERIDRSFAQPWSEEIEKLPAPSSPAAMETIARAQCALLAEHDPVRCAGGRLIVAELRPGRIQLDDVCELPKRSSAPLSVAPMLTALVPDCGRAVHDC